MLPAYQAVRLAAGKHCVWMDEHQAAFVLAALTLCCQPCAWQGTRPAQTHICWTVKHAPLPALAELHCVMLHCADRAATPRRPELAKAMEHHRVELGGALAVADAQGVPLRWARGRAAQAGAGQVNGTL